MGKLIRSARKGRAPGGGLFVCLPLGLKTSQGMKYTQEELDQKIWYRFLKVIFWILFALAIVISFLFAKIEATTKVVDYDKTYETTGERARNMYGNTTQWTEGEEMVSGTFSSRIRSQVKITRRQFCSPPRLVVLQVQNIAPAFESCPAVEKEKAGACLRLFLFCSAGRIRPRTFLLAIASGRIRSGIK